MGAAMFVQFAAYSFEVPGAAGLIMPLPSVFSLAGFCFLTAAVFAEGSRPGPRRAQVRRACAALGALFLLGGLLLAWLPTGRVA
jgi:hypothetical protein